jgi:hypothetical protein
MTALVAIEKKKFPKLIRRTIPKSRGFPCSACGADDWYSRKSGGYQCAPCNRSRSKRSREQDPERCRAKAAKYRENNPERVKATRLKHRYGLTPERHAEMFRQQNGRCAVCDMAVPPGGFVVDHCHDTGKVRDLLCRSCNFLVGFYEQGGDLKAVEAYVTLHRAKLQVMA